ncbi:MAG: MbtH family protein [Catenulispora sp.]|nr:MbtH family protein [Catenulispora sp.]
MNVFDDAAAPCIVLGNEAGEYSLWPAAGAAPGGWRRVFGPAERQVCLTHVRRIWTEPGTPSASAGTSGSAGSEGLAGSAGSAGSTESASTAGTAGSTSAAGTGGPR